MATRYWASFDQVPILADPGLLPRWCASNSTESAALRDAWPICGRGGSASRLVRRARRYLDAAENSST